MTRTACVVVLLTVLAAPAAAPHLDPIVHEGHVEAPLDAVWTALSTREGLRAWLAPHAGIDLPVGGLMRTNYDAQGSLGDAQTIENTILSYDPGLGAGPVTAAGVRADVPDRPACP